MDSEGRAHLAVDIFTESIRYLKDNFLLVIQAKELKIPTSDIYYVITTPSIWSEKAKDFMRKAGEKVYHREVRHKCEFARKRFVLRCKAY